MAKYEIRFTDKSSARVKSLRRAAVLADGQPFVARKLRRKGRKGSWAKFILRQGRICCIARRS